MIHFLIATATEMASTAVIRRFNAGMDSTATTFSPCTTIKLSYICFSNVCHFILRSEAVLRVPRQPVKQQAIVPYYMVSQARLQLISCGCRSLERRGIRLGRRDAEDCRSKHASNMKRLINKYTELLDRIRRDIDTRLSQGRSTSFDRGRFRDARREANERIHQEVEQFWRHWPYVMHGPETEVKDRHGNCLTERNVDERKHIWPVV